MDGIEEKLQKFAKQDDEKAEFIQDLVKRINGLSDENDKLKKQLGMSQYTCQKMDDDLNSLKKQGVSMQRLMGSNPFVLVLIDGDIATFSDDYVQRASLGGHDIARDLRKAVSEYFQTKDGAFVPDTKIVIHVFANIAGLARTYYDAKLLQDPMMFRQFVQGFNKEHPLCHFTDAGDDKEAADNKVKAEMALFYDNVHCKHIMLAASGDNSYAGFLRQYSLTDRVSSRVVLIESIPFASQLEELAVKFQNTHLQGLFRDNKIERKALSFHEDKTVPAGDTPPATYAFTVKQPNGSLEKQALVIPKSPVADGGLVKAGRRIFQNSRGQRVDQQIKVDRILANRLKPLKLCNRHFLTKCHYNPCTHNHECKLTSAEIDALRFIARLSPCQTLYCEDPDCVAGHRCMQGANCEKGSKCWFGDEMHKVDTKITGFITV